MLHSWICKNSVNGESNGHGIRILFPRDYCICRRNVQVTKEDRLFKVFVSIASRCMEAARDFLIYFRDDHRGTVR